MALNLVLTLQQHTVGRYLIVQYSAVVIVAILVPLKIGAMVGFSFFAVRQTD
jgi:hypothetical protein